MMVMKKNKKMNKKISEHLRKKYHLSEFDINMLMEYSRETIEFWESSKNEAGYHVTSDMMADELMEYATETGFFE